jgi:hypothetical protein
MLFALHSARAVENEQMDRIGGMLGVVWTRESAQSLFTVAQPGKAPSLQKPRERMVIPLLAGFNPKVLDVVKKGFGSQYGIDAPDWYMQNQGEVVEGYSLSRTDFVKLAGMFTPLIPKVEY